MDDESPTLENRVGWLEDRMTVTEEATELNETVLNKVDTANTILFRGLVNFLVKENVIDRQALTSHLQLIIETAELDDEEPLVARFARQGVDGLMVEEPDETEGRDMDQERREYLLRRHHIAGPTEPEPARRLTKTAGRPTRD